MHHRCPLLTKVVRVLATAYSLDAGLAVIACLSRMLSKLDGCSCRGQQLRVR